MEKVIRANSVSSDLKKYIFLLIGFASLAIVSSYEAPLAFDVPFPGIIIFIACLFLHCLLNNIHKISIISFLLFLRLVLFIVNAIILNVSLTAILEQIIITITSILVFESMRTINSGEIKIIKNILIVFSFITSVQLVVGFFGGLFSDKNAIVAGIGNSNYAATFLVVAVTFLMFVKTQWFEKFVIAFDIIALLITQSFGAYLSFVIILVIFYIKKTNFRLAKSWLHLLMLIIVVLVVFQIFINTNLGYGVYNKIQNKLTFLLNGNFKAFGSSRLELYEFSWDNISHHLLFGPIVNYNPDSIFNERFKNYKTHNFVLESMLLYGLVGTIINLLLIIIIYMEIKKANKSFKISAFTVTIIAILIHGFVEPNLFTMHFDLFFWLIIGGLFATVNNNKTSDTISKLKN